jgi:hypothetical protein
MRYIYLLVIILFFTYCKKEKNDNNSHDKFVVEILSGENQKGIINQKLDSSINLMVRYPDGNPYNRAIISIGSGDGSILKRIYAKNGVYSILWLLGCNEGLQKLSVIAYDSIENLIDTINISAIAKKDSFWNRSCGIPMGNDFEFSFSSIQKFVEHPSGVVYLTTHSFAAGLFSSNDNGISWIKNYDFDTIPGINVNDLSINSDGTILLSAESGLYKKSDGSGWYKIYNGYVSKCFAIDNQTIFIQASNTNNIYRSNDGGLTWYLTSISYTNMDNIIGYVDYIKQIKRLDNNQILLLDSQQLLLSKDNGLTWEMINGELGYSSTTGFIVKDNYIYVMNVGGIDNAKIYKSSINNISWSLLCTLKPKDRGIYYYDDIYCYNNNLYFLCNKGIYRVSQNGDTLNITKNVWNKVEDINRFIVTKNGYLIVGSYSDKGIFYTNLNVP